MHTFLLAAIVAASESGDPFASARFPFDADADLDSCTWIATGEAARRMKTAQLHDAQLILLESWWKSTAAVAMAAPTTDLARVVDVSFVVTMNTGTEGAGFAWLDVAEHGTDATPPEHERWEAPNLPRAFGVGFDASNPPNRDPFRGSGNVYDRPQHELSLHWDGRELVKRTTPMDFRDEERHRVHVRLEFVTGGAEVSVRIDDETIFDRHFVGSMTAFAGRAAFGATNTETAGDVLLDDVAIACFDAIEPPAPPLSIVALDRALNDAGRHVNEVTVTFPDDGDRFGRILCTLQLDEPEQGYDPWDRSAHVFLHEEDGTRYELIRYITPYDRGWSWTVDVSDFRPLLAGTKRIVQACTTYGPGWLVTVRFDFHPGPADRYAERMVNLWSGAPEIGNPEKPVGDFYASRTVAVPEGISGAAVRTVVTGHGMSPNSGNAAEFMAIGRTLTVNGRAHVNRLWKTDNYLNACRPQGGTWKYDRAGWAPGDVVAPWIVEASDLIGPGRELRIEYALDSYVNENRGETWAPNHLTEAQLVFYRAAGAD